MRTRGARNDSPRRASAGYRACRVCRGPAAAGFARCYRCDRHFAAVGDLLADAVMPIGYAVKGGRLAADLWRYKAGPGGDAGPVPAAWLADSASAGVLAAEAARRLREMLREFLRDHGNCVQQAAGGTAGPSRVAIVPSGQGRLGTHPLAEIVASCVDLPLVRLVPGPGSLARGRDLSAGWLRVGDDVAGRSVLVIDDTWVSGSSAQSAAVALKLAGAARVAVVALGRHVDPADPRSAAFASAVAGGAAPRAGGTAPVPHACVRASPVR